MVWLSRLPRGYIDPALRAWLMHEGSLTAKLRESFPGVRVGLVSRRAGRPCPDEREALATVCRGGPCIREVVLHADGMPLVFAHSVWPRHAERGAWPMLGKLGTRPLGEMLFSDPGIRRGQLAFCAITARHPFYRRIECAWPSLALPGLLWARRSLFWRKGKPLLVSEVFLPALTGIRP